MNKLSLNLICFLSCLTLSNSNASDVNEHQDLKIITHIHEPFWRYNQNQLRDYGKRIIDRVSPYFIQEPDLNDKKTAIKQGNESIRVRKSA